MSCRGGSGVDDGWGRLRRPGGSPCQSPSCTGGDVMLPMLGPPTMLAPPWWIAPTSLYRVLAGTLCCPCWDPRQCLRRPGGNTRQSSPRVGAGAVRTGGVGACVALVGKSALGVYLRPGGSPLQTLPPVLGRNQSNVPLATHLPKMLQYNRSIQRKRYF